MRLPISDEMRQALAQQPGGVEMEDQQTQKVYVLTDAELHHRAMEALHKLEDRDAVQAGIDDMEAGRVVPYEQVSRNLREHLRDVTPGDVTPPSSNA